MNTKAQDLQVVREAIINHMIAQAAVQCAMSTQDSGAIFSAMWNEGNMFREQTNKKFDFARKHGHLP